MNNLVATSGPLDDAYNSGVTLLDNLAKVPTGTAGGAIPTITYNKFRTGAGPTFTSLIPGLLGSADVSGPYNGLVGATY